jgi:hypothetical protein
MTKWVKVKLDSGVRLNDDEEQAGEPAINLVTNQGAIAKLNGTKIR